MAEVILLPTGMAALQCRHEWDWRCVTADGLPMGQCPHCEGWVVSTTDDDLEALAEGILREMAERGIGASKL